MGPCLSVPLAVAWCAGTDCSALFRSMHPHNSDANLKALQKYRVGTLIPRTDLPKVCASSSAPKRGDSHLSHCRAPVCARACPCQFDFNTPFATELRKRVSEVMGNRPSKWYANTAFWLRTFGIMLATLAFEYMWATNGAIYWGVLVGCMHAMIGLAIQHDASHGAFSKNPTVNAFFSYGADWIGNNRWLWMQQHVIGHHPHTNIEGHDPDAHSAEPVMVFHDYGNDPNGPKDPSPRRWFHAWQWIYMFIVLPWCGAGVHVAVPVWRRFVHACCLLLFGPGCRYGPTLVCDMSQVMGMRHGDEVPPNAWTLTKRPLALLTRAWYFARIIIAPIFLANISVVSALLTVPLTTGALLTFIFVVSHNFEGSDRYPATNKDGAVDWYKLQVETSCTYGGSWAMFWSGGLNMQIEHHLFPRMCSWCVRGHVAQKKKKSVTTCLLPLRYYPFISAVVREVCAKHNVQYVYYPSLWENMKSTVRYMKRSGGWHQH